MAVLNLAPGSGFCDNLQPAGVGANGWSISIDMGRAAGTARHLSQGSLARPRTQLFVVY
jgi:hypothetical protein